MATLTETLILNGPIIPSSTANDTDYTVARHVLLVSTDSGPVFTLQGSDHDLVVRGYVRGGSAVGLGDTVEDDDNRLVVAATGEIHGDFLAASLRAAGSSVLNDGSLWAGNTALSVLGSGEVVNNGTIRSDLFGLEFTALASAPGANRIENAGTITGWLFGIATLGDAGETVAITNTGTLAAGYANPPTVSAAFRGLGATDDLLTNRGLISGDVQLGAGQDLFDNRGGRLRDGAVLGEAGQDTFRPGATAESMDGGGGTDTLDFRSGAGLRVSLLDPGANTGRAQGDAYTGIERVWGSATGADTLGGDAGANTLAGNGGDDSLRGGGGEDRLTGGAGRDLLRGGGGDDVFVLARPQDGGDRILDYAFDPIESDVILVSATGFGGGLKAGVLLTGAQFAFQNDAVARTDAVRFLWDGDDRQLWYDRDGDDPGRAILIATILGVSPALFSIEVI